MQHPYELVLIVRAKQTRIISNWLFESCEIECCLSRYIANLPLTFPHSLEGNEPLCVFFVVVRPQNVISPCFVPRPIIGEYTIGLVSPCLVSILCHR